jgi:hypoxanthine phosphoribosyltransferase
VASGFGGAALCTDGIRFEAGREAIFDTSGDNLIEWSPGPAWTGILPATFFGTLAALLLAWRGGIPDSVSGRTVLLIDDILDEGLTIAAIKDKLLEAGAVRVLIAVFSDKDIQRKKPVAADFVGVTLPNRYVFGFGMDVRGQWRNLPAIYALAEDQQD